jgi:hypothetical protein
MRHFFTMRRLPAPVLLLPSGVIAPATKRLLVASPSLPHALAAGRATASSRAVPMTAVAPRAHHHDSRAAIAVKSAAIRAHSRIHGLLMGLDFLRACRDTGRARGTNSGLYGGRLSCTLNRVVPRSLSCPYPHTQLHQPADTPPSRKSSAHAHDDDDFTKTSETTRLRHFLTTAHKGPRLAGPQRLYAFLRCDYQGKACRCPNRTVVGAETRVDRGNGPRHSCPR